MVMSYVQQWLAHLSPEMTLVYAPVSQDSMRKQWEQAMARRAVHVASAGPQPIDPNELIAGNELEYIRGNLDAIRVETGLLLQAAEDGVPVRRDRVLHLPQSRYHHRLLAAVPAS